MFYKCFNTFIRFLLPLLILLRLYNNQYKPTRTGCLCSKTVNMRDLNSLCFRHISLYIIHINLHILTIGRNSPFNVQNQEKWNRIWRLLWTLTFFFKRVIKGDRSLPPSLTLNMNNLAMGNKHEAFVISP